MGKRHKQIYTMDGLAERLQRNVALERQSAALLRESKEAFAEIRDPCKLEQESDEMKETHMQEGVNSSITEETGTDVDAVDVRRLAMSVIRDESESFHFGEDDAVVFGETLGEREACMNGYGDERDNADDNLMASDPETSKTTSRELLRQQQRQHRHLFPRAAARADAEFAASGGGSGKSNNSQTPNHDVHSDDLELDAGISPAAAARLHKARADSLARDLEALSARHADTSRELSSLKSSVKELESSRDKLNRTCRAADTAKEKHAKAEDALRVRCDELQRELAQEKMRSGTALKELRQLETEHKSLGVRFTRSSEEVSSLRAHVKELKSSFRDDRDVSNNANTKLVSDIRRLEKEKAELVKAFKQQMKLVDVLKKQRVHIEAAQLLNFTEAEFRKALEKV